MNHFLNLARGVLKSGGFARNALVLLTGTAFAQVITVAVTPIITRFYDPSLYGAFALYTSLASIVTVVSTGRYDVAVMLPAKETDAVNLVAVSLTLVCVTSLSSLLFLSCFRSTLPALLSTTETGSWLFLMPLTILMTGLYQTLYVWGNRQKKFPALAIGRISGAAVGAASNIGIALTTPSVGGLIVAGMFGTAAASAAIVKQLYKEGWSRISEVKVGVMAEQARLYHNFPLYSLPSDLVNVVAQQAPVILLTTYFGASTAGVFSLTQRVLGFPMALVASSVLDVFRQRASADFNARGDCVVIFRKTFKGLLLLSVIPFLTLFLSAPWLFTVAFGVEWKSAGECAQIVLPLFFLRFVISPLTYVLYIAKKQRLDLFCNIILFVSSTAAVVLGGMLRSEKTALILYSAVYSTMYLVYGSISYRTAKGVKTTP